MVTSNFEKTNSNLLEYLIKRFQKNYKENYEAIVEARRIDKARRMRRSNASIKLQRWITKKLSTWYKLMKQILDVETKEELVDDQKEESYYGIKQVRIGVDM